MRAVVLFLTLSLILGGTASAKTDPAAESTAVWNYVATRYHGDVIESYCYNLDCPYVKFNRSRSYYRRGCVVHVTLYPPRGHDLWCQRIRWSELSATADGVTFDESQRWDLIR
jgi:hypothetical protein